MYLYMTISAGPGEEVLHQFQMSRSERERLKDIDERLRVIQEENERTMQALVSMQTSHLHIDLNKWTCF